MFLEHSLKFVQLCRPLSMMIYVQPRVYQFLAELQTTQRTSLIGIFLADGLLCLEVLSLNICFTNFSRCCAVQCKCILLQPQLSRSLKMNIVDNFSDVRFRETWSFLYYLHRLKSLNEYNIMYKFMTKANMAEDQNTLKKPRILY